MAKKGKKARKRAERRERAKTRDQREPVEQQLDAQESAADEAVAKADADEPLPPPPRSREKRAPKPPREEERDNAWIRMTDFLREVNIERKKINWPAVDETWRSTWVVVVTIVFLALFMGACSFGFARVAEQLFGVEPVVQQAGDQVPTTPLGAVDLDQPMGGSGEGGTEEAPEGN